MPLFQPSWLTAPGSPEAFLLHTLSGMMHLFMMQPCVSNLIWSARKAEKREIHVNYLPDDLKWSVFNLQEWNRAHLIGPFVNLCQPLSTLHLPLHQHLHHGFKLGLCWPLLPIHQTKARTDLNNLLFVPLPIWDNNGHLALRQCSTNYI